MKNVKNGKGFPKPLAGKKTTSWGGVADWYNGLLEKDKNSYQRELILPNLLRRMDIKKGETILDLACGQGFFTNRFARLGAKVIASDISKELVEIAKKDPENKSVQFEVTPSDQLGFIKNGAIDKAVVVLALQNIENANATILECARVLKPTGKLFLVLNHPAFRVPKGSDWGFDDKNKVQYRRVDKYLSESRVKIQMHPGVKPCENTISFHRPLQFYFKAFSKAGLAVSGLEEWSSHRKSEAGPRSEAENRARAEIPMFLFMEAIKL